MSKNLHLCKCGNCVWFTDSLDGFCLCKRTTVFSSDFCSSYSPSSRNSHLCEDFFHLKSVLQHTSADDVINLMSYVLITLKNV